MEFLKQKIEQEFGKEHQVVHVTTKLSKQQYILENWIYDMENAKYDDKSCAYLFVWQD